MPASVTAPVTVPPTTTDLENATASGIASVGKSSLGEGGSGGLHFIFAKLMLSVAAANKDIAMKGIEDIKNIQEEQKRLSAYIQEARQQQNFAGTKDAAQKEKNKAATTFEGCTLMSPEMKGYMDDNKLAIDKTGNDNKHTKDEWEVAIKSLQARLDSLGSDIQQRMLIIQDHMAQYNTGMEGSKSANDKGNQLGSTLARVQ
jgi:hypothetical protein